MSNNDPAFTEPLDPDALARRLAEVYQVLGPLYRKVSRTVERLQPQMGMSVGVRAVLEQLHREGDLTVPQMARAQQLSRQFVQRMVNEAASSGWVGTHPNPAHQRSRLVHLTSSGAEAIDAVILREHELMGRVQGQLTDSDIVTTIKVLTAMTAGLDDVPQHSGQSVTGSSTSKPS